MVAALPLTLAGVLVAWSFAGSRAMAANRRPDGFHAGHGPPPPIVGHRPVALAGLALGAQIGPEAPLIAPGGGLRAAVVREPPRTPPTVGVLGATGSSRHQHPAQVALAAAFLMMSLGPAARWSACCCRPRPGIGYPIASGLLPDRARHALPGCPHVPTLTPRSAEFACRRHRLAAAGRSKDPWPRPRA